MPAQFVIFDFDGTLFDTHQAIIHSIKTTFSTHLPGFSLSESKLQKLIGGGKGLKDVLNALHPAPDSFDEAEWTATYRRIYNDEGQKLVSPFPGARDLLQNLHARGIPMAIVSNKGVTALQTCLANHSLDHLIPEASIIGDNTPGATRKPDPESYTNLLLPALQARGLSEGLDVLVVGDTEADLLFAKNIGAKSVWCRFGYGNGEKCEELCPDFEIDGLGEVERIVDGL
ncbi:hypothetical protein NW768_007971 [Fusarium equiseti]|uniref:Phosphoglycolate phosphatase n=1 Tax=Fusarium equiseti TaxID=61235 RepID=A0ABQ8R5Q8_FUSEQ|nr:hypothetical protein NW768_007971 [Fusarium equiseti]